MRKGNGLLCYRKLIRGPINFTVVGPHDAPPVVAVDVVPADWKQTIIWRWALLGHEEKELLVYPLDLISNAI